MAQLDYNDQAVGFAGMLADSGPNDVGTGVSEEASAEIPFGVAVARGATADGVDLPSAADDIVRGIVVHSNSYVEGVDLGSTGLEPKTCFGVLRRGRIWVKVEEAVSPGDRAYVRYAGSGQKGAFRKSEVVGETLDVTAEGEFQTTAAIDGLAIVDVDFTNK